MLYFSTVWGFCFIIPVFRYITLSGCKLYSKNSAWHVPHMSILYILVIKAQKYINIKSEFVTPEYSLRDAGGGSLETG